MGPGTPAELGQRLPECWSGTDKSWARAPELAAAKKTSKTGLASLRTEGLFGGIFFSLCVFLSNFYYYFFNYFFFLLTPSSSLS